jgi:hypothetical protein
MPCWPCFRAGKFHSDSASTSHSDFAEIGSVQNGVFFEDDSGEG